MRKKLLGKYILLSVPFLCGCLLYGIGSYGIVSSLLFFGGGYVVIKNIFDYRVVNKNIRNCIDKDFKLNDYSSLEDLEDNIMIKNLDSDNFKYKYEFRKSDNIPGLKRTRVNSKVRRKY